MKRQPQSITIRAVYLRTLFFPKLIFTNNLVASCLSLPPVPNWKKITPIIDETLKQAQLALADIDTIAVTSKPGLPGSLLVGVCFAKALAWVHNKRLIGVNHLEGHIFSSHVESDVPYPHLCITASGGHTSLCFVRGLGTYDTIGITQDDAAGEAFDKVAKLLGLPYPGGPIIEQYARAVEFQDFRSYPRGKKDRLDFSFSGLKTAVLYDLVAQGAYNLKEKKLLTSDEQLKHEVASSLLVCIADIFVNKLRLARKQHPETKAITFVGGVACNKYIRERIATLCDGWNIPFFTPSPKLCTDNGAMIAFVGSYKAQQGERSEWTLDIL